MSQEKEFQSSVSSVLEDIEKAEADKGDGLWIGRVTDKVLAEFPDRPLYTCAAGISPSGIVHFGNFRDVMTSYAVMRELQLRGKQARLLFSWDNYDRFRKVPAGVDPSFSRYIGYPLTDVPDPTGEYESYARRFEVEFEDAVKELGIDLDYRYQTKEYKSGRYADQIAFVLQNRAKAADIQLQFKTDKGNQEKGIDPETYRQTYFPVTVYSRFSGTDKTQVLSYDGGTTLTYRCLVTGKEEQIDFKQTPVVKLPWKLDWPMRWREEGVNFEPGGKDHATPGGSYDVSATVARELFGFTPPVFQGYQFVGIQGMGGKMSGSKGNAVSPATLLEIYEPSLLKWLYMRRSPTQSFNLAFDSEVNRQYDEFDREIAAYQRGEASPAKQKILNFSGVDKNQAAPPLSFKQTVALGQITQWQPVKLRELAEKSGIGCSEDSVARRAPKALAWLTNYNADEIIKLRDEPAVDYIAALDETRRGHVRKLHAFLSGDVSSIADLDSELYAIPKNASLDDKALKAAQRAFFKDVYMLLIGRETGPRLSTFLWAVDRAVVLKLLAS
ncbi:MAG: lysine--tRNA ligase [Alphaproteobacteria bacterium]|nr:lysine--tRNA ligase [Alphaproteobacteria bacterium]